MKESHSNLYILALGKFIFTSYFSRLLASILNFNFQTFSFDPALIFFFFFFFIDSCLEDVNNYDSFEAFAKQVEDIVKDEGLNVLLNNAGVMLDYGSIPEIEKTNMLDTYRTNSIGPVILTKVSSIFFSMIESLLRS